MDHHDEEVVVTGTSIEATLELWASSLREVEAQDEAYTAVTENLANEQAASG